MMDNKKNPPPRPILKTRPGITYQTEGVFCKGKIQQTYQSYGEDGKWHEFDKQTNKPTGKVFEN